MKINTTLGSIVIIASILASSVEGQSNEFKIGTFRAESFKKHIVDGCEVPYESPLDENGYKTSLFNVLAEDGFNIYQTYKPGEWGSLMDLKSILRLADANGLKVEVGAGAYYKPAVNSNDVYLGYGTNEYSNCGNNIGDCQEPYYQEYFRADINHFMDQIFTNPEFQDIIWGYHICEEASYYHYYHFADDCEGNSYGNPSYFKNVELPPSNVSAALSKFKNTLSNASITDQKMVVMEANHHKSIHASTVDHEGTYNPQDYLNLLNPNDSRDVFFEGSYVQFPNGWSSSNYADINNAGPNNNWHYLGAFKSIDFAKTKSNSVHKVIATYLGEPSLLKHLHSNLAIPNANWLWFQTYNSIIHGAEGIWFWGLNGMWEDGESGEGIWATGQEDRFDREYFPNSYKSYLRFLAQELRFLVNKDLISTNSETVLYTKTDHQDQHGILPDAASYIPSSLPSEKRNENYGLRYTIRTNGDETIMIITNPLNVSLSNVPLNFRNIADPVIRNSETVEFLFENNSGSVSGTTYKTNRNSSINLESNSVGKKHSTNFIGFLSLSFGPMDVRVLKFSSSEGWNDCILINPSTNTVLQNTDLKYGNGQLFYARKDGTIHAIHENSQGIWVENWLNNSAPKMKSGSTYSTGIELVPENNNEIFYTAANKRIYRLYWNGSSWSFSATNLSAYVREDSELHYRGGQLFYVATDDRLHALSNNGSSWVYSWLSGTAPKVRSGTGFALEPQGSKIYYVAENNRIYETYWNGSQWANNITNSSAYVRNDSEVHYGNGQIFYVATDGRLHALSKNGSTWVYNWLNGSAPKVKAGTGFALVPEQGNHIYYVGDDNNLYEMYWSSSQWVYNKLNKTSSILTGALGGHDVIFGDGEIYFVGINDTLVHKLSYTCNGCNVCEEDLSTSNNYIEESEGSKLQPQSISTGLNTMDSYFAEKINIFPNPVQDNLNIHLPKDISFTIYIIDMSGKTIKSIQAENDVNMDITDLSEGMYIIKMLSSKGIYHEKIEVNR